MKWRVTERSAHHCQVMARQGNGAWNSVWVSHFGWQESRTWATIHCLPAMLQKPRQMCGVSGTQSSTLMCRPNRPQPNPLLHGAGLGIALRVAKGVYMKWCWWCSVCFGIAGRSRGCLPWFCGCGLSPVEDGVAHPWSLKGVPVHPACNPVMCMSLHLLLFFFCISNSFLSAG